MHKNCPHCHEETFGWRELISLDFFNSEECKNCHRFVRNSGWRQLIAVLAIITILLAALPVSQFLPSEKAVFLIPVVMVVLVLVLVLIAKPVKADNSPPEPSAFTPDPNNDKAILIEGWSEDELRRILDDFVEKDLTTFAAFRIEIEKRFENSFVLIFPEDIHPAEFVSLINYLAYPFHPDATGRAIVVAGKTTLNSDFDGLPESFAGKKAILYIPDNDQDHDLVYLQIESNMTLAKSFNEVAWRKVKDPRLPTTVGSLAW
jgi:RNA polymerase subunit RPABC4/transcription elongation factor Spt4